MWSSLKVYETIERLLLKRNSQSLGHGPTKSALRARGDGGWRISKVYSALPKPKPGQQRDSPNSSWLSTLRAEETQQKVQGITDLGDAIIIKKILPAPGRECVP